MPDEQYGLDDATFRRETARLQEAGEPQATWPGWLWAASRARARDQILEKLGSGRSKVALADVGLTTQLFTPAPLAAWMAGRALGDHASPHVYDPCCGTGNLLVAVILEAGRRGLRQLRITGYDLDTDALTVARDCIDRACREVDTHVEVRLQGPSAEDDILGSLVWAPDPPDAVLTNPPWLYQRNMDPELRAALKKRDAASSRDLYAAFLDRCIELLAPGGRAVLLTPRTFLAVRQYQALRTRLARRAWLAELIDLGPGRFPALSGEKSACALSVWVAGEDGPTAFTEMTGAELSQLDTATPSLQSVAAFSAVRGEPWTFGTHGRLLEAFARHPPLEDRIDITGSQNITADNARYVRFHWEVPEVRVDLHGGRDRRPHWRRYAKGGPLRRYVGNLDLVVDWSAEAREGYETRRTANLLPEAYWYREGITYTDLTTRGFHARHLPAGAVFDKAGPALFPHDTEQIPFLLAVLNTPTVEALLAVLNSTLHTQVGDIRALPMPRRLEPGVRSEIARRGENLMAAGHEAERRREASPWFDRPWLAGQGALEARYEASAQAWNALAASAQRDHDEVCRLVARWYGLEGVPLPEQPPVLDPAPEPREAAAQWVATAATQLALSGDAVTTEAVAARLGGPVSAIATLLGESLHDHLWGGGFWKRHLRVYRRSPRLWLVPPTSGAGHWRLIPFLHLAQHGFAASETASSRRAWRERYGKDPR